MKRGKLFFLIFNLFLTNLVRSQNIEPLKITTLSNSENISKSRGIPGRRIFYTIHDDVKFFSIDIDPEMKFTYFGIGFNSIDKINPTVNDFNFRFRTLNASNLWTEWVSSTCESRPEENKWNMFMTDILFTYDAEEHSKIEIEFNLNSSVQELLFEFLNGKSASRLSGEAKEEVSPVKDEIQEEVAPILKSGGCVPRPQIVPRSSWCGGGAPCSSVNTTYTSTLITPTHAILHYGATPNTYTSGQEIVRGYWDYHVNFNGWADIAYHYLIDKNGVIYQGRRNADDFTQDIQGAHASASNPYSIGFNYLGNTDVTLPTTAQNNSFLNVAAWWFDDRNINPIGTGSIITSDYGTITLPRLFGHNQAMNTSCPGTQLGSSLSSFRNQIKAIIDACSGTIQSETIPPSSSITPSLNWITNDFTASIADTDNSGGSGIEKCFYQVRTFDGANWTATNSSGFVYDDFNMINSNNTVGVGNWNYIGGDLVQTNNSETNSSFHIPVNQTISNRYYYEFNAKFTSTLSNQRLGLHIFADNIALPNRGNNYLIFFRQSTNAVEIIKVTNDVMSASPIASFAAPVVANNTNFNIKITADRINGKISIYFNGAFLGTYTDSSPIPGGQFVSFRNAGSSIAISNLEIQRSRVINSATVTVGALATKHANNNNPDSFTPACKIVSVNTDIANNMSAKDIESFNIDYTPPSMPLTVNDGLSSDISTNSMSTSVSANWTISTDLNSNIVKYWYCVGSSPAGNDIVGWTDNNLNLFVTRNGLNLAVGTIYYVSVRSENGAGLLSAINSTNGQLIVNQSTNVLSESELSSTQLFMNEDNLIIAGDFRNLDRGNVTLLDATGRICLSHEYFVSSPNDVISIDTELLSTGLYYLRMTKRESIFTGKIFK
jgi:hypothetical protein